MRSLIYLSGLPPPRLRAPGRHCLMSGLLVLLLCTTANSQNPQIVPWQCSAADWRLTFSLAASGDSITDRLFCYVMNDLPDSFQPQSGIIINRSGSVLPVHISSLGNKAFQALSVLPPCPDNEADTLSLYLSDAPQCDTLNFQCDTLWASVQMEDTNQNGLPDRIRLSNGITELLRRINESQQKLFTGLQAGKNSLRMQCDTSQPPCVTSNLCSGMLSSGTSMTIRKQGTSTDYSIQFNRPITGHCIKKTAAAADVTLDFAPAPAIPFTVKLRYLIPKGLPFVQQSIIAIPDSSDIEYFIPNDCPVYWAERAFYTPAAFYHKMYSNAYGWDSLWQKWNTNMRYLILSDSSHQLALGSLLHNKGVIRINKPSPLCFDMFDSYGYHADGLCLRNCYAAGQTDDLIRQCNAACLTVNQLSTENKICNILYPNNMDIIPGDDSLRVMVSTPAADSLLPPVLSMLLVSPDSMLYTLLPVPLQGSKLWQSSVLTFPNPSDTGVWTLMVQCDTSLIQRKFVVRNFVHPCLFFDTSDVTHYRGSRFTGFHQTLWNGLLNEINSIRYYYNNGSAPIQTGANAMDIRGYEHRMQALAFRLLLEWNETDWNILRAYVFNIMNYPEWGYEEGLYDQAFNNLDLTHSQFLMGLACAYDWLYPRWNQSERRQLREFIRKEANDWTHPSYGSYYMRKYPVIDWSTRSTLTNNHYWINNAAIEMAARLLDGEVPADERNRWLDCTIFNLQQVARALPPDGGSHEGPGYHAYGFQNLAKWMAARRKACGWSPIDTSLWLKRASDYELGSMIHGSKLPQDRYLLANFADCPLLGWSMPRYYMALAADILQDPLAQWITKQYYENFTNPWTYIFYNDSIEAISADSLPRFARFDTLGLVFHRSSWSGDNNYLAFKCGAMMGGHAQPDLNSFILARKGIPLAIDPGYSYKKYTAEHNTLLVSQTGQVNEGTQWLSAPPYYRDGKLTSVRQAGGFLHASGNASASYIEPELQTFKRDLIMMDTVFFLLLDEVAGSDTLQYDCLLHGVQWKLYPGTWSYLRPIRNENTFSAINAGWRHNTLGMQLGIFPLYSAFTATLDTFRYVPETKPEGGYNSDFSYYNYGFMLKQQITARYGRIRNLLVATDSCELNVICSNDSCLKLSGCFPGMLTALFEAAADSMQQAGTKGICLLHAYDSLHWRLWAGNGRIWTTPECTLGIRHGNCLVSRNGNILDGKSWCSTADTLSFDFPAMTPVMLIDSVQAALTHADQGYEACIPPGNHSILWVDSADYYHDYTVNGHIVYANSQQTSLAAVRVFLCDTLRNKLDSTLSSSSGSFQFPHIPSGQYRIYCRPELPAGGINSTDALQILRHFVRLSTLEGLYALAADVDHNQYINSLDALYVQKYFTGQLQSFPAGPWISGEAGFTVDNQGVTVIVPALCTGDVNGSYIPFIP
ncbi:MAG TPA: heparinase II/III family protein [Bacteroidales bacterium]|nr:heparinase II/III family protein [Bacteroidales bacterium]HSA43667.1 heparinase II/III family protein [Bacteroidales bacterium]